MSNFSIAKTTHSPIPPLPLVNIKEAILGKRYSLSVVFSGEKRSRMLNKRYRGKNKPANVLAFPLSKYEGELVITPIIAKRQAPRFLQSYRKFLGRLFIHGLLHLKGLEHGATMEKEEQKYLRRFNLA